MNTHPHPWYVVRVRSNFERTTSRSLQGKGYETYLPVYRTLRKRIDRVKEVEVPLFPGYTFCRLDAKRHLPVLQSPGVISILGSSAGLISVTESEVEAVRRLLISNLLVGPWPFLRQGQSVVVDGGPLCGLEGYVVEVRGRSRLVVSVSLLNRSVFAEIDREWIRPIHSLSSAIVKTSSC